MKRLNYFFYLLLVVLLVVTLQCDRAQLTNTGEGKMADKLFPANSGIINVKTAYGAKGDGITDDTAAIQKAIAASVGFDKRIYFPNGTYLVSQRLEWKKADGTWASGLGLQGQSRANTIIKLKDNAAGFADPQASRAVIYLASKPGGPSNATTGGGYNAFNNHIFDMTVDVGSGNPGATAIDFFANNIGSLRDVTIRGTRGQGRIGLRMQGRYAVGPCLIKNVSIDGFDYGIWVSFAEYSVTFEHITLTNQKLAGIRNDHNVISIRDLKSTNSVPAIINTASPGLITLVDGNLSGGAAINSAIDNQQGVLYARNITTTGYQSAINNRGTVVSGNSVTEFVSNEIESLNPSPQMSLGLPIQETPEYFDTNLANWASVVDFGAVRNNDADDRVAIQAALDSGKSTIYFPTGRYKLSGTLYVRGNVKHIIGLGSFLDPIGTGFDSASAPKAMFRFESSTSDVLLEQITLSMWFLSKPGLICVEHATPRSLTLRNVLMWGSSVDAAYRSTAGAGNLFLEDVSNQAGGTGWFFGPGQNVWARQFNLEGDRVKVTNNGANLWVLGIKTEAGKPIIDTLGGGKTEVLGGLVYAVIPVGANDAAFSNHESSVSLIYGESCYTTGESYRTHVRETRGGVIKTLMDTSLTTRSGLGKFMPLYVGYTGTSVGYTGTSQGETLFVVGATTLNSDDTAVKARLESLDFRVTVKAASVVTANDASGKDVVVVSSTVSSSDVNTKFRNVAVPVLAWESYLFDDLGMTGSLPDSDYGKLTGQTQIAITNATHPLAASFTGMVTVTTAAATLSWAKPNASASKVATPRGDASKAVIFAYDTGAVMPGIVAPARRVGLFLEDAAAAHLTANGWALFDAAVRWATSLAGLKGEYYDNKDFTILKVTRTDPTINFDWGSGSPDPLIGADTFSVRWTGQVQPRYSEVYSFHTNTNDGVRLWVNGQQIIDDWIPRGAKELTGKITLTAGQKYDIKMEHFEDTMNAAAKLLWSSPSQAKEIVPKDRLYAHV